GHSEPPKKLHERRGAATSKTNNGELAPPEIATSPAAAANHTATIPTASRVPTFGTTAKQTNAGLVANAVATAIDLCAAPFAHAKSAAAAIAASQNQQASKSAPWGDAAFAAGLNCCCVDTRSGPASKRLINATGAMLPVRSRGGKRTHPF